MDLDQTGTAMPGRTSSFYDGVSGTPGSVASSLNEDSAVLNAKVAGEAYRPHSVLQFAMPSGNGMSAADRERVLPGGYTLPSANGSDEQSNHAVQMLRLMGRGI